MYFERKNTQPYRAVFVCIQICGEWSDHWVPVANGPDHPLDRPVGGWSRPFASTSKWLRAANGPQHSNTSYILGSFKDLNVVTHHSTLYLVARVPWDTCLTYLFGGPLLSKRFATPNLLATYLGGIARLIEAVYSRDNTFWPAKQYPLDYSVPSTCRV